MKNIKLILKGILLWVTILITILFISSIDSIIDNGYLFYDIAIIIILIFTCYKVITEKEVEILSGTKLFEKWFNCKIED